MIFIRGLIGLKHPVVHEIIIHDGGKGLVLGGFDMVK